MTETIAQRWAPAAGFEDAYSVSDAGLLRSERAGRGTVKGLILKPRYTKDGYIKYALQHKRKRLQVLAHRLVYQSFIRPLLEEEEIDHLNGDKQDNRLENLEPVSKLENIRRSFRAGRNVARGSDVGTAKLTEEVVSEIREKSKAGMSSRKLRIEYGLAKGHAARIVGRKSWKHVA